MNDDERRVNEVCDRLNAEREARERDDAKRNRMAHLVAFFPPELVGWEEVPGSHTPQKPGDLKTVRPFVGVSAVTDRLDSALGVDNWRVTYDNPRGEANSYTRCTLAVRFEPGGDWITRVGLSNTPKLDKAHAEALRDAAQGFGIGRYLAGHVQSIPWNGHALERAPKLPEVLLPEEYKSCGRVMGRKVRDLVNQCCDESGKRGRVLDKRAVASWLGHEYGRYQVNAEGDVDFSRFQARHASNILARCNDWLACLARGEVFGVDAPPVSETEKKTQEGKKSENKSASQQASASAQTSAQTTAPQGDTRPQAKPNPAPGEKTSP